MSAKRLFGAFGAARRQNQMFQITVSSHPSSDLRTPSVVITNSATGKKYLFGNVGEGFQRLILQNKLGLNKIDHIFLTGQISGWNEIGGLPGFILTSLDQGRQVLNLNYGTNSTFLKYIIFTWRYFIFRFGLKLNINESKEIIDLGKEGGFKVSPVVIGPSSKSDLKTYSKLDKFIQNIFPTGDEVKPKNELIQLIKTPVSNFESASSCNYLIEFNPKRGKFMVSKAQKLGIPPGPLYLKLSSGESVVLPDGRKIDSNDVLEPVQKFGRVLIVHIPSSEFIKSTLDYNWDSEDVQLVYHFLGDDVDPNVVSSPEYQNFIQKFDAHHYVSHSKICSDTINFHSSAILTLRLKSLNNELFRLPRNMPRVYNFENVSILKSLQNITIKANQDLIVQEDLVDFDWDKTFDETIKPLNLDYYSKEEILSPAVPSAIEEPEIITLGTGSALPGQHRNVISTVLRIPSFGSLILDAGENTIGSIKRLFQDEEYENFFKNELKLIYLSHLHADHHLGIISLIKEFSRYSTGRNLTLICPWQYDLFLKEWFKFNSNDKDLSNIEYLNCEFFEIDNKISPYKQYDFEDTNSLNDLSFKRDNLSPPSNLVEFLYQNGISNITTCKLIHCPWAYSVAMTFTHQNFKIAYSGDTRPNQNFVKIGQDCNLLIHESTLEDELLTDLIEKKHTTIQELKLTLLMMNCENLVLTHFSQRYPKLPTFTSNGEFIDVSKKIDKYSFFNNSIKELPNERIIYAFDNMWFKLSDLSKQYKRFNELDLSILETELNKEIDEINEKKRPLDEISI